MNMWIKSEFAFGFTNLIIPYNIKNYQRFSHFLLSYYYYYFKFNIYKE
jgi:hypothetical protein